MSIALGVNMLSVEDFDRYLSIMRRCERGVIDGRDLMIPATAEDRRWLREKLGNDREVRETYYIGDEEPACRRSISTSPSCSR